MGRRKAGIRAENPKAPWYCSPKNKDIIGASQQDHSRMRRVLSNGFSAGSMLEQQPLIKGYVDLLIQRLREKSRDDKSAIDLSTWYNYCTFDIVGDLSFGEPFGCLRESAMHPWISLIFANIKLTALILVFNRIPILYVLLPFLISPKLYKQFKDHQAISRDKVEKRLSLEDTRPDFVQNMVTGTKTGVCYLRSVSMRKSLSGQLTRCCALLIVSLTRGSSQQRCDFDIGWI